MTLPVFVIGQGDVYLTPQLSGMATMTFCHEGQYTKLRDVDVGVCYSELAQARSFYPEDSWFYVGQASHQLFIGTKSVCDAIDRLKNSTIRQRVHWAVSNFFGQPFCPSVQEQQALLATPAPSARTFSLACPDLEYELIHWLGNGYKITTAMCPEQHPVVVASKDLYRGPSKVHKHIVILHSPYPSDAALIGKVFVLTKVPSGVSETSLRHEVVISRALQFNQVPHVIHLTSVIRGIGMRSDGGFKHGLLSEYLDEGNLRKYIVGHFDHFTRSLQPIYRQRHLTLALQIATVLSRINFLNLVYGDMRPENILIRLTENDPEAILADFGLTEEAGCYTTRALGYYPPPEAQPPQVEVQKEGGPPSEIVQEPRLVEISLNVDSWALGIVLFNLFHGFFFDVSGFSFKNDRETILMNRERLFEQLAPEGVDAIDDLIRRLLDIVPTRRIHSSHAVQALEKIMHSEFGEEVNTGSLR